MVLQELGNAMTSHPIVLFFSFFVLFCFVFNIKERPSNSSFFALFVFVCLLVCFCLFSAQKKIHPCKWMYSPKLSVVIQKSKSTCRPALSFATLYVVGERSMSRPTPENGLQASQSRLTVPVVLSWLVFLFMILATSAVVLSR